MSNIKWRIYPTLLNRFAEFERGKVPESEVLDMINHTEKPPNEWMLRGKAYHLFTQEPFPECPVVDGNYIFQFWKFPKDITDMIREERSGGVHEVYNQREFDTGKNKVMLFCFADTLKKGIIYDLKLVGWYRGLKFMPSWQHKLSLFVIPNIMFRYLITDFKGIFYEDYSHNFTLGLADIVDRLVTFMDERNNLITYEKIRQAHYEKIIKETGTSGFPNLDRGIPGKTKRRSNKRVSVKKKRVARKRKA